MHLEDKDQQPVEPLFASIKDCGRIAGLSSVTIYRLIAAQRLTAVKAGTKTLVEMTSLRLFLASLPRFVGRTGRPQMR